MRIRTIPDQIDLGSMVLPESRRGYVPEPPPSRPARIKADVP